MRIAPLAAASELEPHRCTKNVDGRLDVLRLNPQLPPGVGSMELKSFQYQVCSRLLYFTNYVYLCCPILNSSMFPTRYFQRS